MKKEQAEQIIALLIEQGAKARLFEKYSGRLMFGDTEIGIVTDYHPMFIGYFANQVGVALEDLPVREDEYGTSYIYY